MPSCSVRNCFNSTTKVKKKNLSFFEIPEDDIKQEWLSFCEKDITNLKDDK